LKNSAGAYFLGPPYTYRLATETTNRCSSYYNTSRVCTCVCGLRCPSVM